MAGDLTVALCGFIDNTHSADDVFVDKLFNSGINAGNFNQHRELIYSLLCNIYLSDFELTVINNNINRITLNENNEVPLPDIKTKLQNKINSKIRRIFQLLNRRAS